MENEDWLIQVVSFNLKRIRKSKSISQEELGFMCGVSKNYVSDFERGKRNITLKVLQKIIEGLDIIPDELFKPIN